MNVAGAASAGAAAPGAPVTALRILVLAPRFPYPVIGGDRLRIHAICRELARRHRLTLLSLCESASEAAAPWVDDGVFERVERVVLPRWRSLLSVALALPGRTPLQVAYYRSPAFRARFEALASQHDVCVAHLIRVGDYAWGASIPTVLEMTDAISMNYRRLRERGGSQGWRARIYAVEAERLHAYERRAVRAFPVATLVSDVDRDHLVGDEPVPGALVCSNGVDTRALAFVDRSAAEPVIAFVGAMGYLPNLDACRFFASEVLPVLRERLGCRLRIVGRIGDAERRALERFDGVEVTGAVDSVAQAVASARIGVAPMRLGAGVQNKVLEYMALGLPAVVSSLAAEGLGVRAGREIVVADSRDELIDAITGLWDDAARRRDLAHAARRYVEAHHDWAAMLAPMVAAVERLGAARRATPPTGR